MAELKRPLAWQAVIGLGSLILAVGMDPMSAAGASAVYKVGQITWHPRKYVNRDVIVAGYVLARTKDYVLFSDEPSGKVSTHDLPVSGANLDQMRSLRKYVIEGTFLDHGLAASNGNRYHLELTGPPKEMKP
jgi:hypothetical protein